MIYYKLEIYSKLKNYVHNIIFIALIFNNMEYINKMFYFCNMYCTLE